MTDIEKLIEDLHGILKQYGEKIPYGELVGAPWPYSRAGDLVWPDPEPYFIEQAATALSMLQGENKQLRGELEYEREHANAYHKECGQWEAENEKLRAELERVKADRDAAIEYLREIEWCAGCKYFGGLDGCKKWAMGQCTEKHDLYEFIGPQKED